MPITETHILSQASIPLPLHCLELENEPPLQQLLDSMAASNHKAQKKPGIFCRICNHLITTPETLILINDRLLHEFTNPLGICFQLQCYSAAPGAAISGKPTDYYSWFPEHYWQYVYCKSCGHHLGWYFSKSKNNSATNHNFFGFDIAQLTGEV